ncbi:MAG: HD-GYP domain-containing protein [Lachnospiraceae bacterium]|nr:HD-GYP domain-containing protein [Lachnospiraceae bacterium]
MRIDQAIIDKKGRTLIARGAYLDDFMIDSLLQRGVGGIYTSEGEDEPDEKAIPLEIQEKIEKLKVADPAKVKLTESVKNRVSEGIQYLYQNTESESFSDTTNNIANNLMKAVLENDSIAVDISTLKVSDEYTFKHSVDVATMAMVIARKHGLSDNDIYEIGITGLLHDVGKSKIPNDVLNKPGKLNEDEFALMKQHTLFGYQILKDKPDIKEEIRLGVLQHHEKINGKGYPLGLSRNKINSYAKILAVADIYDALVTKRPYKEPFSQRDAVEMIMSMTSELDIDIMKSFLGSVILYPVGSTIKLSNGKSAKVVENNSDCILRPKVVELSSGKVYDLATDLHCANIIIL